MLRKITVPVLDIQMNTGDLAGRKTSNSSNIVGDASKIDALQA
jgi:hypothetical protein